MDRDPDANAPPPAAPSTSEESDVGARPSHRDDNGTDEEHVRDVDPHPDTPDDFDDDAFARAIAEGRARDPEEYGGQKIA